MNTSVSGALALELRPHSPTHWVATYYPLVATPAGCWADVTWVLHQCVMASTDELPGPARWLQVGSCDPDDPCYADHRAWRAQLAAGYATARAVHNAEPIEEPSSPREAQQIRDTTVVVPVGQLSEWVLDDLENETSPARG